MIYNLGKFLRYLRQFKYSRRVHGVAACTSVVSLAVTSSFLIGKSRSNNGPVYKLVSTMSETSCPSQHTLVRLFYKFASIELDGEAYMTPRDFIDCVVGARPPVGMRRRTITASEAEKLISKTPKVPSKNGALFQTLDRSGLISCSEYLFLLSILTNSSHNLQVLFQMFDRDRSESIEFPEFLQIIRLCNLKYQDQKLTYPDQHQLLTTLMRHFFNKDGRGKLLFKDFFKFIFDLQTEILRSEFYRFSLGCETISPLQLADAILRYADLPEKVKVKGLQNVAENLDFTLNDIDFDAYSSFFHLLFQCDDLFSALKMFVISNRAISKEEFQRAARVLTGRRINDTIVSTVFLLFDADGDGHLSADEFIAVTRSYLARGTRGRNPAFQFAYWPRYVARVLRFRAVFRGDLQGWSFEMDRSMPFQLPDAKPHEYAEEKWLPVWRFSEQPPWNMANRLSSFPFKTDWCVIHPDGKRKTRERLPGMPPDQQTIFRGDRVIVLRGPSRGKIGIVGSVVKMRNMVYVEGLNPSYRTSEGRGPVIFDEKCLKINEEVALIDPVDKAPCTAVWRFDAQGNRVRVSKRSGHLLPLPAAARILDDLTDPASAEAGDKDTPTEAVTRSTVDFVASEKLETFEEELTRVHAPQETRKRMQTFWY